MTLRNGEHCSHVPASGAPIPRKLNSEISFASALAEIRSAGGDSNHWKTDSCTAPTQQLAATFGSSLGRELEMLASASQPVGVAVAGQV